MGLFGFIKKNEAKTDSDKKAVKSNSASEETYSFKVENDQIPFHDIGIDIDVKLLVRAEFFFKGNKPDENAVNEAAIQSFKDAFSQIEGQIPASEFTKSANMNALKKAMRESMVAQGLNVYSVMINWMSYNKEYKEIVYGKTQL